MPRYKNIKIREETYDRLRSFLSPGETFDHGINRLFDELRTCQEEKLELDRRVATLEQGMMRVAEKVGQAVKISAVDIVSLDKASWYGTKMLFSIQALKIYAYELRDEKKARNQLRRLKKVLEQIKDRYGVRTGTLLEIARQFVEEPTKENMILLNEASKEVVKSIFLRLMGLEALR